MQSKENKELWQKYNNNFQFQDKMNKKSLKFRQFEQLAFYLESQQTSRKMIIPIKRENHQNWQCKIQQRTNIVIILGLKQPNGNKSIENILLNIVKFIPRPSQSYSIIYINTLASNNAYNDFKSILQFLPIEYLRYLDKIFVLQANYKNKGSYWWSFDYFNNFIKNKTIHTQALKDIIDKIKIDMHKFLDLLPIQIVRALSQKEEHIRKYLQSKENQIIYNTNIFNVQKQTYLQPKSKPKLLKNQKNTIQSYELGQTGAPLTIELLISYFNGKQQLLNTQGIFRKSVSIEEQTQLLKQLAKGNYDCIQEVTNPHLIANAIKRFLSNLDEPIIPFKEFNLLMSIEQPQYKQNIAVIVNKIGNNRKMTLLLLVDFFKEKLLPRTASNKMNQNNLSIVFAPCLMRSQTASLDDLINTKKSITITSIILKECDMIFGNRKQRLVQIRKSIQSQQRQSFLQRLKDTENLQKQESFQTIIRQQKQIKLDLPNHHQNQNTPANKQKAKTDLILTGIFEMIEQQINQKNQVEQDQFQQPMLISQIQQKDKYKM